MPDFRRFSFKMPELPAIALPRVDLARFTVTLTPRRKRHVLPAATAMMAAGLGAVIGAAVSGGFSRHSGAVADLQERAAMEQAIARLNSDIGALKASIAASGKTAHGHVAGDKIAAAPKPAQPAGGDITGSIPASTPLPQPRPAIAESAERSPVVKDWSIRFVRDGYVYVQGRGEVYEVVPGAPLPGLGPVQSIKRQDGRWVVATPKGLIVSQRDRRFFE